MNLCIAALSKATNQLKDISVVQIQVPVGGENSASTESVNAGDSIADCYYKAFLWNDNMLPVALPIEKFATDVNRVAINPTDDVFTRNGTSYQNTNYGANELLGLKHGNAGYKRYVYIKFTLPEEIASVQRATLRLYGGTGIVNSKPSFNIYQIANDWNEDAVTWSNAPGMGNKIVTATSPDVKAYIEIDITDYVISQVETDRIIAMGMDTGSSDYIGFNSKEALENRPK